MHVYDTIYIQTVWVGSYDTTNTDIHEIVFEPLHRKPPHDHYKPHTNRYILLMYVLFVFCSGHKISEQAREAVAHTG